MAHQQSSTLNRLAVEYLATTSLTPNPRNARRHGSKQIAKLASAIKNFGFGSPLIIDEEGVILAGHARHAAAIGMGLEQVPCDAERNDRGAEHDAECDRKPGQPPRSHDRHLASLLVARNVEASFRGSVLGKLWTALVPLLRLAIYTTVLGLILKVRWPGHHNTPETRDGDGGHAKPPPTSPQAKIGGAAVFRYRSRT